MNANEIRDYDAELERRLAALLSRYAPLRALDRSRPVVTRGRWHPRLAIVLGFAAAVIFLTAGVAIAEETSLFDRFRLFTNSHQQPSYPASEWMVWALASAKPVSVEQAETNGQFPLLTSATVPLTSVDQMILPCDNCPPAYRLIYRLGDGVTATVYETLAPRPAPGKSVTAQGKDDPSLVDSRNAAGKDELVYYTARDHALVPAILWTTPQWTHVVILFDKPVVAKEALAFAASFQ